MPDVNDKLLDQLRDVVLRQIEKDEILLPALPTVVLRALTVLRAPDYDMAEVARVIEPDPVVAARVIRLANNASHGGRPPTTTIAAAITRVGAAELSSFLIEISAQKVFASQDSRINQACRQLWIHSLAVAMLARDLAGVAARPQDEAEAAYLAGLLHDIGKPVLAGVLLDAERRLRGKQTRGWIAADIWVDWVLGVHRQVGLTLARKWDMPRLVVDAIADTDALDAGNPHAVANFVALANALAKREKLCIGQVDADEMNQRIAAAERMLGLSNISVESAVVGLRERVTERLA